MLQNHVFVGIIQLSECCAKRKKKTQLVVILMTHTYKKKNHISQMWFVHMSEAQTCVYAHVHMQPHYDDKTHKQKSGKSTA